VKSYYALLLTSRITLDHSVVVSSSRGLTHEPAGQTASVEEVKATLRRLIGEITDLDPGSITDSSTLDEDIPLPSIQFVELQAAVEDIFDIQLDPIEVLERNTFGAVAALICEKVHAGLINRE
jgi:acyl carrier protein